MNIMNLRAEPWLLVLLIIVKLGSSGGRPISKHQNVSSLVFKFWTQSHSGFTPASGLYLGYTAELAKLRLGIPGFSNSGISPIIEASLSGKHSTNIQATMISKRH